MVEIGTLIVDEIRGTYSSKRYDCDYTVYVGPDGKRGDGKSFQAQYHKGDLKVFGRPYNSIERFAENIIPDAIDSLDEKLTKLHDIGESPDLGFLPEHHELLPRPRENY